MQSYVILMNWTDQGSRQDRDTLERAKSYDSLVNELGGKVREHVYTMGDYDVVMVTEFPDDESAAASVLKLATLGNVRTTTMRAFTDNEMVGILSRTG